MAQQPRGFLQAVPWFLPETAWPWCRAHRAPGAAPPRVLLVFGSHGAEVSGGSFPPPPLALRKTQKLKEGKRGSSNTDGKQNELECQEMKNSEQINQENELFFFFRSPAITQNSHVICKDSELNNTEMPQLPTHSHVSLLVLSPSSHTYCPGWSLSLFIAHTQLGQTAEPTGFRGNNKYTRVRVSKGRA